MPLLRVWVHCPRASNGSLPPRSHLVGYVRWDAQSDRYLLCQTITPTAFRSQNELPTFRHDVCPLSSVWISGPSRADTQTGTNTHSRDRIPALPGRRWRLYTYSRGMVRMRLRLSIWFAGPVSRFQAVDQVFFRGSCSRIFVVAPPCMWRQAHENGLDTSTGSQAERGAAIV